MTLLYLYFWLADLLEVLKLKKIHLYLPIHLSEWLFGLLNRCKNFYVHESKKTESFKNTRFEMIGFKAMLSESGIKVTSHY